jgi:hypothetical protein
MLLTLIENSCIGDLLGCVCIGVLGLVWGDAQPLNYIIVILLLESIEQPFSPPNMVSALFSPPLTLILSLDLSATAGRPVGRHTSPAPPFFPYLTAAEILLIRAGSAPPCSIDVGPAPPGPIFVIFGSRSPLLTATGSAPLHRLPRPTRLRPDSTLPSICRLASIGFAAAHLL